MFFGGRGLLFQLLCLRLRVVAAQDRGRRRRPLPRASSAPASRPPACQKDVPIVAANPRSPIFTFLAVWIFGVQPAIGARADRTVAIGAFARAIASDPTRMTGARAELRATVLAWLAKMCLPPACDNAKLVLRRSGRLAVGENWTLGKDGRPPDPVTKATVAALTAALQSAAAEYHENILRANHGPMGRGSGR